MPDDARARDGARVESGPAPGAILRAMDLTFVGWIVVGLIAGLFSGVVTGGRTARGWMPSLFIGLIAAVLVGWLLTSVTKTDGITSIWVSALFAAAMATVIRLVIMTFTFSDD